MSVLCKAAYDILHGAIYDPEPPKTIKCPRSTSISSLSPHLHAPYNTDITENSAIQRWPVSWVVKWPLYLSNIFSGYEKPKLRPSSNSRSSKHLAILFRLFHTLFINTLLGYSLFSYLPGGDRLDTSYLCMYLSGFGTIWCSVLGKFWIVPCYACLTSVG